MANKKKSIRVDKNLLKEITGRITNTISPEKIILFGSYAYGEPTKDSDLDILVVMNDNIASRRKIASQIYSALCGIFIPKDILVITLNDIKEWRKVPNAFITKFIKRGKILYEK